jgi:hypothetical protein
MNTFNYAELTEIEENAANANSWNPAVDRYLTGGAHSCTGL